MPYDIRCPGCHGIFHETTENFRFNKSADGTMFKLKHPFNSPDYMWTTFPSDTSIRGADLVCPWCETCYVDETGRVINLIDQRSGKQTCRESERRKKREKLGSAKKKGKNGIEKED